MNVIHDKQPVFSPEKVHLAARASSTMGGDITESVAESGEQGLEKVCQEVA